MVILRPTLEPKTDFIVPPQHRRNAVQHTDGVSDIIVHNVTNQSDLYADPYLNIKYKVVNDPINHPFDARRFIADSAHSPDPMKLNSFDQIKSDTIGAHRDIGDSRHFSCQSHPNWENLPTTSIIMTYFNEARSALLRSVTSGGSFTFQIWS